LGPKLLWHFRISDQQILIESKYGLEAVWALQVQSVVMGICFRTSSMQIEYAHPSM